MSSVTVVIAAWNAEAFLADAINSALSQDGVELEVLVIDDASSDQTSAVAEAISDPRIRVHRLDRNQGPSAARKAGFDLARHDWIAVLDADDRFLPGRLQGLCKQAESEGADIVADNVWITVKDDDTAPRLFVPEALDGGGETLTLAPFVLSNRLFRGRGGFGYLKPLFRRQFLQDHALGYDSDLRIGEDYHLVAEALAAGAIYRRYRMAGYCYLTRDGSLSHRMSAAQALAMAQADGRLLDRWRSRLTPEERAAIQSHRDYAREGSAFLQMVEALKDRRLGDALKTALQHPAALRHFMMPISARLDQLRQTLGLRSDNSGARKALSA
jgi:succinoglycan biosynthesis protein ExoO